jgi:hypothetical protein
MLPQSPLSHVLSNFAKRFPSRHHAANCYVQASVASHRCKPPLAFRGDWRWCSAAPGAGPVVANSASSSASVRRGMVPLAFVMLEKLAYQQWLL